MKQQNNQSVQPRARWILSACVFIAIVGLGIASRFWLLDMPNFKPIAALVLFGGFFFQRAWPAMAALVLIMVVSDLQLGIYDWQLLACVYSSLAIACLLGVWVKRSLGSSHANGMPRIGSSQTIRFVVASLVMSTVFYLLTNGAVWMTGQWYPETWSGLINCYAAGLPFYRATLLGDLMFTGAIVGVYCCVQIVVTRWAQSPVQPDEELAVCYLSST